jgi:hypothetical protein
MEKLLPRDVVVRDVQPGSPGLFKDRPAQRRDLGRHSLMVRSAGPLVSPSSRLKRLADKLDRVLHTRTVLDWGAQRLVRQISQPVQAGVCCVKVIHYAPHNSPVAGWFRRGGRCQDAPVTVTAGVGCLHRHLVTVTEEEEARRKVFEAQVGSRQELRVAVRHRRTNRQLDVGIPGLPWDPIIGSRRETPDGRRRQSAAISRSVASC